MESKFEARTSRETESSRIEAASRKVFPGDALSPTPIFTNAIEFTNLGGDMFMDVGFVSPEAVQSALQQRQGSGDKQLSVDVTVIYRFGLSVQTATVLAQRLNHLLEAVNGQRPSVVRDEKE